eukprot:g2776.t1
MSYKKTFGQFSALRETFDMHRRKPARSTRKHQLQSCARLALSARCPSKQPRERTKAPKDTFGARSKSYLEKMCDQAAQNPGPSQYRRRDGLAECAERSNHGRFKEGGGKSAVEWELYRAASIPAPGTYSPADSLVERMARQAGGRFKEGGGKSAVEWELHRAKDIPAPGTYSPADSLQDECRKRFNGRFNLSQPLSDTEQRMRQASEQPGPGAYTAEYETLVGRVAARRGGKFRQGESKSALDWQLYRSAQVPSPTQYGSGDEQGMARRMAARPGGRFQVGDAKSDIEWQVLRAAETPAPGGNVHLASDFGDITPLPDAGSTRTRICAAARAKVDISPPGLGKDAAPGGARGGGGTKADLDGLFADLQEKE